MADLRDLLAQRAELEKQIGHLSREQREAAIAEIRRLMAEHKLTAADVAVARAPAKKGQPRAASKVAAKYRDPETGSTWSGRGLQPKWLKAAIEGGKKAEDFAV